MLATAPPVVVGHSVPRIAPPLPLRADTDKFRQMAAAMGITLMPWQETAATYLTALDADDLHLYREVCIVVARQNGKTELMKPLIVQGLRRGLRILHIAQTRELPRIMFRVIATAFANEPNLFAKRPGRGGKMQTVWPRYGSGQEEIEMANGGLYRIAAANSGGARGLSIDLVIIDELREMETDDVIASAEPTMTMSPDPQMIYLSNAGTEASVVLNNIRKRAGMDDSLAYLEWSAQPERPADDVQGWAEANPALGHYPQVMRTLEAKYLSHKLAGTMPTFETEHLCRWVVTLRERLVEEQAWLACEGETEKPRRPMMAIAMDPSGTRASAAIAWRQTDDKIAVRVIYDIADPDTDALGVELKEAAARFGVRKVGIDPLTDGELAKHFSKTESLSGRTFANASARFTDLTGKRQLVWDDAGPVTADLAWTAKKPHDESGSFQAVRANDERPITGALAAIRAVYLVDAPGPKSLKVY